MTIAQFRGLLDKFPDDVPIFKWDGEFEEAEELFPQTCLLVGILLDPDPLQGIAPGQVKVVRADDSRERGKGKRGEPFPGVLM